MIEIDRERERETETQAEGEAGSMQGARCRSRDSRITPWTKGRRQTAEPPRDPRNILSKKSSIQIPAWDRQVM